jgi:hypothetical protein
MASAPAVIGLVRKFAGDQFADHVADCLIPLDGAYARARQGANMVTDPCENIVTNPAGRAPACLRQLLTSMSKQRCACPLLPVYIYIKPHQEI